MKINKIGYHHTHDKSLFIQRPTGSGDYLLLFVFTPSKMILQDKTVITSNPFFILYKKDTPQFYCAYEEEYTDDWMHFSMDENELSMFHSLGIPMDIPVKIDNMEELSLMIKSMTYEFHTENPLRQENLYLYMRLLFNKLSGNFDVNCTNPHYYVFHQIRSGIYNNPGVSYSVDTLAKKANVSRSAFQHIYRELFGISTSADIIKARTEYACYLLSTTSLTIRSISSMCGYHSDIHFMRQFKSQTGQTPTEYRKMEES